MQRTDYRSARDAAIIGFERGWGLRGMDLNASLPALVPAVIALIVVSVGAVLALAWDRQPQFQTLVRRIWLVAAIVIVGGVAIFWISTVLVGSKHPTVSRSLQQQQQDELRERLQKGGH
jgi:hypothetical protein